MDHPSPLFTDHDAGRTSALPTTTQDFASEHAPEVQAWLALARAFQHTWVKRFDTRLADAPLASLDELRAFMGGDPAHMGALVNDRAHDWYEHVSKTKRIRWGVSADSGVLLRVSRPSLENWADPHDHEIVIDVSLREAHHEDTASRITVDTNKILAGEYGRRHVAVMHTALYALVGLPPAFGVTKKQATILVKMIAAGAS